jgi:hypothetical protein
VNSAPFVVLCGDLPGLDTKGASKPGYIPQQRAYTRLWHIKLNDFPGERAPAIAPMRFFQRPALVSTVTRKLWPFMPCAGNDR